MDRNLQEVLVRVDRENRDRNLRVLLAAMEPFVGSLHIIEWDRQTWGQFVTLALGCAVTRDDITDAFPGVRWDDIDAWVMGLHVPSETIRQELIRMVLASESRAAA